MPHVKLDISEVPTGEGINGEMQALAIALKSAGENIPFAVLMGIGGLAFRIYWHVGREDDGTKGLWSDSSLEACGGMHPLYMACQWVGWTYSPYLRNTLDEFYQHCRASIDKGIPAIVRGPDYPVAGLVIGYEEEATRKLIFVNRFAGLESAPVEIPMFDLALLEHGHWRNPVFVIDRAEKPAPEIRQMLLVEAFGRCAEVLNTPDIDGGRWIGGVKVYDVIAKDLETPGRLDEVWPGVTGTSNEDDERVYFFSDYLAELGRARGTAFEFLDTYADEYPIGPVARNYEKVYELYNELREIIPDPRTNYAGAHKALFDDELRKEIAAKLREMGRVETKAATVMKSKQDNLWQME